MSKPPPQHQLKNANNSLSLPVSDKQSNDSRQLLLAHLYNYFKTNGLEETAQALLIECNNTIPKATTNSKGYSLDNSGPDQKDTFLDQWWGLLWSIQSSINPNLNQMTNPSGILTPQHQMIVQQRMLQQQQQQAQQQQQQAQQQQAQQQQQQQQLLQQQRLQQQAMIQQQHQQQLINNLGARQQQVGLSTTTNQMGPPGSNSNNLQSNMSPNNEQLQSQARLQQLKLQFQQHKHNKHQKNQ